MAVAAPLVLERFCSELERTYGEKASVAVRRLRHSPASGTLGPWAGFNIRTYGDGPWMYFEIRNLWSPAPRLRVWHWHWPDSRTRRAVRRGYELVGDKDGFRLLRDGAVFERHTPGLENADGATIADAIWKRLGELLAVGVFDPDIRYQNRHYG
jgi:hypothetical protein